jgi:hypothetical protein
MLQGGHARGEECRGSRTNVPLELRHEGLAEAHHFAVALTLCGAGNHSIRPYVNAAFMHVTCERCLQAQLGKRDRGV